MKESSARLKPSRLSQDKLTNLSPIIFMLADRPDRKAAARKKRLAEIIEALTALQFGPKQRNQISAHTLIALLDHQLDAAWADAQAPLRGITCPQALRFPVRLTNVSCSRRITTRGTAALSSPSMSDNKIILEG